MRNSIATIPEVWNLFKRFTEYAIVRGKTKLSTKFIIERIRWEVIMEIRSHDEFKINNNHTAYYARKWLKQHPEHPKFFEVRKARGDDFDSNGQGVLL